MAHNNQYLSEILNLITEYYNNDYIENSDLLLIGQLLFELANKPIIRNNITKANIETFQIKMSTVVVLPTAIATKYRNKFLYETDIDSKLKKTFKVPSTFFRDSLTSNPKRDIVLELVDYKGSFELAYLVDDGAVLLDQDSTKLNEKQLKDAKKAFDEKGIGANFDAVLKKHSNSNKTRNTRKITIEYKDNFDNPDDFTLRDDLFVYFLPAIVVSDDTHPHKNQLTLLMFFSEVKDLDTNKFISPPIIINVNEIYYDTFQLCPPGNC